MTSAANWSRKFLKYEFANPELLTQALTHKSSSAENNERLEFLGDAVLGLVIAQRLYQDQPDSDEGVLSRFRATLVRRETLADISAELKLGDQLILGSGEKRSGGHQRRSVMADALEALFGAVYLDQGYRVARDLILFVYATRLAGLPAADDLKDPKTMLQEALQAQGHDVPVYDVVNEEGPPHNRRFEVRCSILALDVLTQGSGTSRRKAEQAAAESALATIQQKIDESS